MSAAWLIRRSSSPPVRQGSPRVEPSTIRRMMDRDDERIKAVGCMGDEAQVAACQQSPMQRGSGFSTCLTIYNPRRQSRTRTRKHMTGSSCPLVFGHGGQSAQIMRLRRDLIFKWKGVDFCSATGVRQTFTSGYGCCSDQVKSYFNQRLGAPQVSQVCI